MAAASGSASQLTFDELGQPIPPVGVLERPILYIHAISAAVSDEEIVSVLEDCLKVRLNIERSGSKWEDVGGSIEFNKYHNAEKAYATLHNYSFQQQNSLLQLSRSNSNTVPDPQPNATLRFVKFLPSTMTSSRLFDLFRPFGPIYSVSLHYVEEVGGMGSAFKGTALIHFYEESQASRAQMEMHCVEVDGMSIAVEEYEEKRDRFGRAAATGTNQITMMSPTTSAFIPKQNTKTSKWSPSLDPNQPVFKPSYVSKWSNQSETGSKQTLNPNQPAFKPSSGSYISKWSDNNNNNNSSQPQYNTPSSPSLQTQLLQTPTSALIAPCNLFIKNIAPDLDSSDLFSAFRRFGHIVSARVMKHEQTGLSREFGFVSFSNEESTMKALEEMNHFVLGTSSLARPIVVSYHQLRKTTELKALHQIERQGSSVMGDQQVNDLLDDLKLSTDVTGIESPSMSTPQTPNQLPTTLTPTSERDRLLTAVLRLPGLVRRSEEVVELLLQLPNRDRKMCLFNPTILASKVEEAREVLEAMEDPEQTIPIPKPEVITPTITTPLRTNVESEIQKVKYETIDQLATLPALDIIKLAFDSSPLIKPNLLPIVSNQVREETNKFIDNLTGLEVHAQKQKVGEKCFVAIKQLKIKGAPAIAIALLDTEDLRALTHIVNSYPDILRAKVMILKNR